MPISKMAALWPPIGPRRQLFLTSADAKTAPREDGKLGQSREEIRGRTADGRLTLIVLLVEMTDCHRHDGYHYAYAQLHLQPSLGDSSPDTEDWSFATNDRCMSCKWVLPAWKV